jgi:hypothetical protein
MNQKQSRVQALVQSIVDYLQTHKAVSPGIDLTLAKLAAMDLSSENLLDVPAQQSRHNEVLNRAIDGIVSTELYGIAECLRAAKEDLQWQEDNAQFYAPGADLGEGYKQCNLHTLLIGPDACGYHHPDFSLGIFMLGPRTLYRDHNHDAPELYLNLSEQSGWRLESATWQDYPAGSFIWNPAGQVHATKVYSEPFISVFAWLEKIHSPCRVIHSNDWEQIEQDLAKLPNRA